MRVPLISGAYEARSIIANAQRCINLYQEKNQEDSPVPVTHYLTPGLILMAGSSSCPCLSWQQVTAISQAGAINTGYITNNASLVTVTLPAIAAIGDLFGVAGKGAGGWRLAQNAGQTISYGNQNTTVGATGSLASISSHDTVELICITANTNWQVVSSVGNITVT